MNEKIVECLRSYRKAVGAYGELIGKLKAIHKQATAGLPVLPLTRRNLEEASSALDCIGDGLSLLPELAELLECEMRFSASLRNQAVKAGLVIRYDADGFRE